MNQYQFLSVDARSDSVSDLKKKIPSLFCSKSDDPTQFEEPWPNLFMMAHQYFNKRKLVRPY
jgi:hypothetical protein